MDPHTPKLFYTFPQVCTFLTCFSQSVSAQGLPVCLSPPQNPSFPLTQRVCAPSSLGFGPNSPDPHSSTSPSQAHHCSCISWIFHGFPFHPLTISFSATPFPLHLFVPSCEFNFPCTSTPAFLLTTFSSGSIPLYSTPSPPANPDTVSHLSLNSPSLYSQAIFILSPLTVFSPVSSDFLTSLLFHHLVQLFSIPIAKSSSALSPKVPNKE